MSRLAYLATWTSGRMAPSYHPNVLDELVAGTVEEDNYILANKVSDFNGLIPAQYNSDFGFAQFRSWVNIGKEKLYGHLQLGDTSGKLDKEQWQRFWSLFNIFQTDEFVELQEEKDADEDMEAILEELLPLYENSFHSLLEQAVELGVLTIDNIDYIDSLLDDKDNIIADGDLVLEQVKVVINPYTDESRRAFEKHDYTIYSLDEINEIDLKELLNKQ